MKMLPVIVTAIALGLSSALPAHDDATLDKIQAPNGGQLRAAGIYHYELVVAKDSKDAKENPIVVYVTDHGATKIDTKGATGTITLLAGKTKITVALAPDGDNRMRAKATYASDVAMKAVVSITLSGKAAELARFTPLQRANVNLSDAGK